MKIVGVTGGSGSGKSSFCKILCDMGASVVDADKISHRIIMRGGAAFDEIISEFGSEILEEDGEINRHLLGEIVFSDKKRLTVLNQITHSRIFEEMRREISQSNSEIVLLDVPLLFSSDFPIEYDLSIAVIADEQTRIERIAARDKITPDAAKARIAAQMSEREMSKLADICVDNSRTLGELYTKAERIYHIIKT